MCKPIGLTLLALVAAGLVPVAAHAQTASIAGVVRDTSGAVLPGVTVEAASPALIEKMRTVTTDGAGAYQIVNLRPGTYSVTFSLQGFSTVKREGIELSGSFAAPVNAEMKVGTLTETVTVTSESPVVDVQSTAAQRAFTKEVLDSIPAGRSHLTQAVLIPGLSTTQGAASGSLMDVGGTGNLKNTVASIHGSRVTDTRVMIDGVRIGNMSGAGQWVNFVPDEGAAQEVAIDYGAVNAEYISNGLTINYVPREGGNTWRGSLFATAVTGAWQGNNITPELSAAGLTTPTTVALMYDINPSGGGPIMRDKLWFWASARFQANENDIGGFYKNANAGDPNAWSYAPSDEIERFSIHSDAVGARVTWQAAQKHKLTFYYNKQRRPWDDNSSAFGSETSDWWRFPCLTTTQAGWTSPLTSRLLLEGRWSNRCEEFENAYQGTTPARNLIPVFEQGGLRPGTWFRGHYGGPFVMNSMPNLNTILFTTSYVTGSHAFKVGFTDSWGYQVNGIVGLDPVADGSYPVSYVFNNGVPNSITQYATPWQSKSNMRAEMGIFAQDRWTINRATVTAGLRYDWLSYYYSPNPLGPSPLAPNRNFTLPAQDSVDWKNLTPRVGVSYDLFGDGKTALKFNAGKYVINADSGAATAPANPIDTVANVASRSWTPTRPFGSPNYYVPNCDLLNPLANGDCGPLSNLNFGGQTPAGSFNPATYTGWNTRPHQWEFTVAGQQQLSTGFAVSVGYFRRVYGNFTLTDNLAVTPADFTQYSITAPLDPRLPNGGGYTVSGLYDLNPDKVGQVNNFTTFADDYGKWIEHWNGVDVTVDARTPFGLVLQGGTSTGRRSQDVCEIRAKVPEMFVVQEYFDVIPFIGPTDPYCKQSGTFTTQVKLLGTYTIPKYDVLLAFTFQHVPGPQIGARFVADNSIVGPSLGRPLSGGVQNVLVNLVEPGSMWVPAANLADIRIGKILRFGERRVSANLDIHNLFNSAPVLLQSDFYADWQAPRQAMSPRLFKLSFLVNF
jgi:hypothetical protein